MYLGVSSSVGKIKILFATSRLHVLHNLLVSHNYDVIAVDKLSTYQTSEVFRYGMNLY